jgi:hypothetical protein
MLRLWHWIRKYRCRLHVLLVSTYRQLLQLLQLIKCTLNVLGEARVMVTALVIILGQVTFAAAAS